MVVWAPFVELVIDRYRTVDVNSQHQRIADPWSYRERNDERVVLKLREHQCAKPDTARREQENGAANRQSTLT